MAFLRMLGHLIIISVPAFAAEPPRDKFSPGDGYGMERLEPAMPKPLYVTAPVMKPHEWQNVEGMDQTYERTRKVELKAGCRLLSHGCKVTSSDPNPRGELQDITDGVRSGEDGWQVDLATGQQWVQIDLGKVCEVHCIWIWRFHRGPVVFRGVRVDLATSEEGPWHTVYDTEPNPCCENPHPLHYESSRGFPVSVRGQMGRFVRLWSAGADKLPGNHYIEVSVYGQVVTTMPADYFRPVGPGKVKLEPELPRQFFTASPSPPPGWPNTVESGTDTWKRSKDVVINEGCRLLSHRCPVTVSDAEPLGEPSLVTDGLRSGDDAGNLLEMAPGRQWVLIDLGVRREIHCIWLWLCHRQPWGAHRNVIVQITDDPQKQGAESGIVALNNDHDGSEGFGEGTDLEWEETVVGRPITFPPVTGRYVRVRSNGRTLDGASVFTEVAVYGKDMPGDAGAGEMETDATANQPGAQSENGAGKQDE